jgi:hypothetical protein
MTSPRPTPHAYTAGYGDGSLRWRHAVASMTLKPAVDFRAGATIFGAATTHSSGSSRVQPEWWGELPPLEEVP